MTLFLNLSPSFRLHKIFQSSTERQHQNFTNRGFLFTRRRSFFWRNVKENSQCRRNKSIRMAGENCPSCCCLSCSLHQYINGAENWSVRVSKNPKELSLILRLSE